MMRPVAALTGLALGLVACGDGGGGVPVGIGTDAGRSADAAPPRPVADAAAPVDCEALPPGPFAPVVFIDGLGAAEDLAFDGEGGFVAVGKSGLVRVGADAGVVPFATSAPLSFLAGLRYAADRSLIALEFLGGRAQRIAPGGAVSLLADGLRNPNAVAPARDGAVYISETEGDRIVRIPAGGGSPEVMAAGDAVAAANGVVYDEQRRALFFAAGLGREVMTIGRIDLDGEGAPSAPVEVYVGDPGNGDGISLDVCGNLYVLDNYRATDAAQRRVIRLRLDASGAALGTPELIAELPVSVANPVFGRGPGFDPASLYVTGFAGTVFRVPVGVTGAATALTP
jgi:sugar lactone lactonase YvrE